MTIKIIAETHLDHLHYLHASERDIVLAAAFAAWEAQPRKPGVHSFTTQSPISLYSDLVGPVAESDVEYRVRPGRACASRVARSLTPQPTNEVTLVIGPHAGEPHVLYTVYAGPAAPREPGDPSISSWDELQASREFWSTHALAGLNAQPDTAPTTEAP